MMPSANRIQTNPGLLVALIIGSCVAYSGLYTMPLWIGAMADHLTIDPALLGVMGSVQLLMAALASIGLSRKITRCSAAQFALYGTFLVILANLASAFVTSLPLLFLLRGLSGLGEGILLANLNVVISRTDNPDRYFTLSQTTVALFGIGLFLNAPGLTADFGVIGVFGIIVLVGLIAMGTNFYFPRSLPLPEAPQGESSALPPRKFHLPALPLLALGVLFIGCQGGWAYLERMGVAKGFRGDEIGNYIMVGLLISLLGPLSATFVCRRLGRRFAIITGLTLSGLAIVLASQNISTDFYKMAAALFPFATLFIVTSYLGYLAQKDSSGAMVAAAPAFINMGGALGPAVMGLMLSIGGYPVIGGTVVISYLCAATLLFLPSSPRKK